MSKALNNPRVTRFHTIGLYSLLFTLFILTQSCKAQTVYITRTGEKYHLGSCQYLRSSKISIALSDAQKRGYTACSVCRPPLKPTKADSTRTDTVRHEHKQTQVPVQQNVTSRQCSATTKAGTRCKRMTTNANGRCWQHQ